MDYTCRIEGIDLHCIITSSMDITAPVFCFSGMAPMTATVGGMRVSGLGSFTEVALPDLHKGQPHHVTLQYTHGYKPANRAWLPLGPYLRTATGTVSLPPSAAGCRPQPLPDLGPFDGLHLIPQPQHWAPVGSTIMPYGFAFDDAALDAVSDLADRRGLASFKGDFPIKVIHDDAATDAYTLTVASDGITIAAGTYGGRFYAGVTLLTLLQHGPLPFGKITDAPRFDWRGQHLDTARHYYDPQTIFDLLDVMALLKLNRFHWHFADDEAFRLEVESLPDLWQKTAHCGEGHLLPALFSGAISAGGSYSKDTARAIIAHAKALNIEVMPEIEVPAHAIAITHVFPDMRDPADNGAEVSVQGYHGNAVNPAMPKTWEVIESIVQEVGALFPFNHLHLGCDELPEGTWMGSPAARTLMKDEGLETTDDLQGWMMAKIAQTVVENGQRPAAWEEAAKGSNGGIGNDAILFSWTGQGPGVAAAKAGYDVVMTPAQHVYLDMAHTDDVDDWGASWAAFISLSDTVNWNPVPDPAIAERIIGVQGTFWSEFTTKDAQIWPMLLPRIFGVAAQAWHEAATAPEDLLKLSYGHFLLKIMPQSLSKMRT